MHTKEEATRHIHETLRKIDDYLHENNLLAGQSFDICIIANGIERRSELSDLVNTSAYRFSKSLSMNILNDRSWLAGLRGRQRLLCVVDGEAYPGFRNNDRGFSAVAFSLTHLMVALGLGTDDLVVVVDR